MYWKRIWIQINKDMKKLYVTLFSALFLGGAICASCTDKKDASAEEVINTIHKVNNYWQTNHPEHGRSFWDNACLSHRKYGSLFFD